MELNNFIDLLFSNVMSSNGIEKIKSCIKEDFKLNEINYETTKVEFQIFEKDKNYDPKVSISSEGYSDGEIIFIDYYLNKEEINEEIIRNN